MRLVSLDLVDVGPFAKVSLPFKSSADMTLFTGRNGSGKTVMLDAIRYWFGGQYAQVERPLARAGHAEGFGIALVGEHDGRRFSHTVQSATHHRDTLRGPPATARGALPPNSLTWLPLEVATGGDPRALTFVTDYWCPATAIGTAEITALEVPNHRNVLTDSLQGTYARSRATQFLCHVDYLRESREPRERRIGEALHDAVVRIIEASLLDGRYVGIDRLTLTPKVEQAGHIVPLGSISSGNAYLIHRMLGLLGKMYSVAMLRGEIPEADASAPFRDRPGLLLIDEVENHLHPRWQKRVLPALRALFPNVQIVATTHAPLVLASVPGAQVMLCRYDDAQRACEVVDVSEAFARRSVEEILLSDAFDETLPWGEEVSALLDRRARALAQNDDTARITAETELAAANPARFGYLAEATRFGLVGGAPR
jgi:hypothetical protein